MKFFKEVSLKDEDILCGGKHQFTYDGGFDIFYSVYCLNSTFEIPSTSTQLPSSTSNLVPTVSTISSTTTQTVSSTEKPPNDVLKDILDMLVSANVINIIMIGLLIMINLLVIVLVVWCFLFLESQDPNASARFYNPKQKYVLLILKMFYYSFSHTARTITMDLQMRLSIPNPKWMTFPMGLT